MSDITEKLSTAVLEGDKEKAAKFVQQGLDQAYQPNRYWITG